MISLFNYPRKPLLQKCSGGFVFVVGHQADSYLVQRVIELVEMTSTGPVPELSYNPFNHP
jgi:hypothetical protein